MASLTQWTWAWVNSRSWWWTGRPGVLQSMGSQRVGHDWATKLNWTEPFVLLWEQLCFRSSLKHLSHLLQVSSSCVCLSYHLERSGHSESVLSDYATPSSTRYTHLPATQAHLLNILWLDHNPPRYLDTSNILYVSHSQKWLYNSLSWTGEHAVGSCVLPLISVE